MKINSITTNAAYLKHRTLGSPMTSVGERANIQYNNSNQNNNEQINTTIKSNSDGRVSFKGNAQLAKFMGELPHKIAGFTSKYPLVAEALFALVITCGARPLTILATAKTDEDKEKCSYQAAKSISSGLVGLAMTAVIGTAVGAGSKLAQQNGVGKMPEKMKEKSLEVVKKGANSLIELAQKLTDNGGDAELVEQINKLASPDRLNLDVLKNAGKGAEKTFIGKIKAVAPEILNDIKAAIEEQKSINNFDKTSKNIIDKFFQPVFMPIRATITTALVPVILKSMGIKKTGKKQATQQVQQMVFDYAKFQTQKEKELFQPFLGGNQ